MSGEENSPADEAEQLEAAALAALLSSGLIVGPDPHIVEEVRESPDLAPEPPNEYALESQVEEIYQEISQRAPEHKIQPSTERVAACLEYLGNPQDSYRAIHITGTNGKTSTARMIEALLREKGLRTGRFTSPHLTSVRERICINGVAISAADFIETWEEVKPIIEMVDAKSVQSGGSPLSFFEVFTVMAYAAFDTAAIDVAVVEVGMGGIWDATNVITADIAVLMPVGLDHQKWLGATVADIAREKLGILKERKSLICAPQVPEVLQLVEERVAALHARLFYFGEDFRVLNRERGVGGQLISVQTPAARYEDVPVAMFGAHQALNAAVALKAVEEFFGGGALDAQGVEQALMATTSPGRLEVLKGSPAVIVDAAHNPAGMEVTLAALEENFPGERIAVFSAMADKDIAGMLSLMEPSFSKIVVTQMPGPRGAELADLAAQAEEVFGEDRVRAEADLGNAISAAAELAAASEVDAAREAKFLPPSIVILGSIMLVAQARELLGARRPDSI